jgi:hypothetical protein
MIDGRASAFSFRMHYNGISLRGGLMPMLDKFGMQVWGVRNEDDGQCGRCFRHKAVVWVDELDGFRCGSCLAGTGERRGRPKGSKNTPRSAEDRQWIKEHFPEHYAETFGTDESQEEEAPETVEDIISRAGKMGPPESPGPVGEG